MSDIDFASAPLDCRKSPPENTVDSLKQQMIHFGVQAQGPVRKRRKGIHQLTLITTKVDKAAPLEMDVAIADFIRSNGLAFWLSECLKLAKVIDVAQRLPIGYKPPNWRAMSSGLLTNLTDENRKHSVISVVY